MPDADGLQIAGTDLSTFGSVTGLEGLWDPPQVRTSTVVVPGTRGVTAYPTMPDAQVITPRINIGSGLRRADFWRLYMDLETLVLNADVNGRSQPYTLTRYRQVAASVGGALSTLTQTATGQYFGGLVAAQQAWATHTVTFQLLVPNPVWT